MSDVDDLADLHELPWSEIEGAHVRVRQEIDDNDMMDPASEWSEENVRYEEREGDLAGRHRGWKVKWHKGRGDFADPVSPRIVLHTPDNTYLEVSTDTLENELLEFEPQEDNSA